MEKIIRPILSLQNFYLSNVENVVHLASRIPGAEPGPAARVVPSGVPGGTARGQQRGRTNWSHLPGTEEGEGCTPTEERSTGHTT